MSENNKEEMVKLTHVVFPWGAGYGNWSCQRPKIAVLGRPLALPKKRIEGQMSVSWLESRNRMFQEEGSSVTIWKHQKLEFIKS